AAKGKAPAAAAKGKAGATAGRGAKAKPATAAKGKPREEAAKGEPREEAAKGKAPAAAKGAPRGEAGREARNQIAGAPDPGEVLSELVLDTARKIRRRPDAVFELERPEKVVPLLPVQELLFAISEMGRTDSQDLVALTTPEQFQAFLDLSVWTRDQVELGELEEWMQVLGGLEDRPFLGKLRALDPELLCAGLAQMCAVIQVEDPDEDPTFGSNLPAWWTPDRFFVLMPTPPRDPETGSRGEREEDEDWDPDADEHFALAKAFVERLYRADPHRARSLLMETISGTVAEQEEFAYRWRAGRVADLGYETYAEALGVLAYLDPRAVRDHLRQSPEPPRSERDPTDPASLGGVLLEPWLPGSEERFLDDCLERLNVAERDRLTLGYTFLANRVAAATLASPGDAEEMRQVLVRVRQGLNLGLMYLTEGQGDAAPGILSRTPLTTVFRVGYSLTLKLKRLVDTLHRQGRISLAKRGATLLEGPWLELAEGLSQRFPALSRAFDAPPGKGTRPLLTLEDLGKGAALVEDLAVQWPLCFLGLRFSPRWLTEEGLAGCQPHEPGAVRLGDLFRTAWTRQMLGETFGVEPLTRDQQERAESLLTERARSQGAGWCDVMLEEAEGRVRQRLEAVAMPAPDRLGRILASWLEPLKTCSLAGLTIRRGA
ncbi:MAG: DUF6178 family protein, partial [Polyangia bacterium]|nr:DUF6178 family protein [Polyangia bacterium]